MSYEALNADQRSGTTLNGKLSLTVAEAAAQLTRSGLSWSPTLGTAATVTYAFRATAPATMPDDAGGFAPFNAQQIAAAEAALKAWSSVANITFVRVGSGTSGSSAYSDNATILFGDYTTGVAGASAFAYQPGSRAASSFAGDVWVNSSLYANGVVFAGSNYGYMTLMHEIGHAIGLSHPSNYDASDSGTPTYAQDASYAEDSREYSIMSYFAVGETGGKQVGGLTGAGSPLIDDIAAAQRLYGANMTSHTGNDVYGSDGYLNTWQTIWDAGGNDTISAFNSGFDQKIDLHPGAFSDIYGGVGNLSIALGTIIENAEGGSGNDTLIGNDVANTLNGGAGNDTLIGNLGDDTLNGGAGIDTAVYFGHLRQYTITHFTGYENGAPATLQDYLIATSGGYTRVNGIEGNDTLTSIEYAGFRDGFVTFDADSMRRASCDSTNPRSAERPIRWGSTARCMRSKAGRPLRRWRTFS